MANGNRKKNKKKNKQKNKKKNKKKNQKENRIGMRVLSTFTHLQDNNAVGRAYRAQAMRDRDDGPAVRDVGNGSLHLEKTVGRGKRMEDGGKVACVRWCAVGLSMCNLGVGFLHGVRFRHPMLQESKKTVRQYRNKNERKNP